MCLSLFIDVQTEGKKSVSAAVLHIRGTHTGVIPPLPCDCHYSNLGEAFKCGRLKVKSFLKCLNSSGFFEKILISVCMIL